MEIPCSRILIDGKELEVFRCRADGGLVFNHQDLLRLHPGHTFSSPIIFKEGELDKLGKLYEEVMSGTKNG